VVNGAVFERQDDQMLDSGVVEGHNTSATLSPTVEGASVNRNLRPDTIPMGDGPDAVGPSAITSVLWGLSYFFWRRREVTLEGAGDAKRN